MFSPKPRVNSMMTTPQQVKSARQLNLKQGIFSDPNVMSQLKMKNKSPCLSPDQFLAKKGKQGMREWHERVPEMKAKCRTQRQSIAELNPSKKKDGNSDQLLELSKQLVKELSMLERHIKKSEWVDAEIEVWAESQIRSLKEVQDCSEGGVGRERSGEIQRLQQELVEEKKQRFAIEEEASRVISEQEREIQMLEERLRQLSN